MNILQIMVPQEGIFYHAKKGLSKGNCLRLTNNIEEAQTYNNVNSAKGGVTTLLRDINMAVSFSRWGFENPFEKTVTDLAKKGHNFKIDILEATIVIK